MGLRMVRASNMYWDSSSTGDGSKHDGCIWTLSTLELQVMNLRHSYFRDILSSDYATNNTPVRPVMALRAIKHDFLKSLIHLGRALLIRAPQNMSDVQGSPLGSCNIRCCSSGRGCSRSARLKTFPKLGGSFRRVEIPGVGSLRGGGNNCQGAQMCGALFGQRCSVIFPGMNRAFYTTIDTAPYGTRGCIHRHVVVRNI